MRIHKVKTNPEEYDLIAAGMKRAELRFDDRGYRQGDVLEHLRLFAPVDAFGPDEEREDPVFSNEAGQEVDDDGAVATQFTRITHVQQGGKWGLAEGWVMLSIERMEFVRSDS